MTPHPPAPTFGRRLTFVVLLVAIAVVAIETISFLAAWSIEGRRFSPSESTGDRQKILRQARLAPEREPEGQMPEEGISSQVVHPFIGFVLDPDAGVRRVDPEGFASLPGPPWSEDADEVRVAVFGGSVANGLASKGRRILIEALGRVPEFDRRPIVVRNFALGGYKQPQQLMILTYMLSLGQRFDVVINIDGFNEVALPYNARTSVFPFYPTKWPSRVGALNDLDSQRRVGEIAHLRQLRARRSGLCNVAPLRWSPTCDLVWRRLDASLQREIFELQGELDEHLQSKRAFRTHGPLSHYPSDAELFVSLAEHWRTCSLLMHQLCSRNGIHYFHFLQPNQYDPGSKPMGDVERRRAIAEHFNYYYPPAVRLGYPKLAAEGKRLVAEGVAFYDLRMIFADHPEPIYRDKCCHYNLRGNQILARRIARTIAEHPALAGG